MNIPYYMYSSSLCLFCQYTSVYEVSSKFYLTVQVARNVVDFFAERLYNATIGKFFGTNDDEVIRIIVARSEVILNNVSHTSSGMSVACILP